MVGKFLPRLLLKGLDRNRSIHLNLCRAYFGNLLPTRFINHLSTCLIFLDIGYHTRDIALLVLPGIFGLFGLLAFIVIKAKQWSDWARFAVYLLHMVINVIFIIPG